MKHTIKYKGGEMDLVEFELMYAKSMADTERYMTAAACRSRGEDIDRETLESIERTYLIRLADIGERAARRVAAHQAELRADYG